MPTPIPILIFIPVHIHLHVLQTGFFTPGQSMHRSMLGKGFFTVEIWDFLGSLPGEKVSVKNTFSTIAQTV